MALSPRAQELNALFTDPATKRGEMQFAMNFTACWIGTYEPEHRDRCIALGERTGLYRDEVVPRGCVPGYLPEFIGVQSAKVGT